MIEFLIIHVTDIITMHNGIIRYVTEFILLASITCLTLASLRDSEATTVC